MLSPEGRKGGSAALAAYLLWGLFPLYFNRLAAVPAIEVLSNRVVWGALFGLAVVLALGRAAALETVFRNPKRLCSLAASALCISINWGTFIWAVGNGHTLDASIGYFINPLVSVLLGAVVLHERLSRRQKISVVLVVIGVGALTAGASGFPWVALVLPATFGLYGLIRKLVPVDALTGFTVETLLIVPFAALYLVARPGGGALLDGGAITTLLVVSGPVTAVPLVLFAFGARRLRLATLGLMQYVNPTIQMAIAVAVFGEPFTGTHWVTFGFIWAGLLLYSLPLPATAYKAPPAQVDSA